MTSSQFTTSSLGDSGEEGADLLSLVTIDRTEGNAMKLHWWKFRWDIWKRFFRLSREAIIDTKPVRVPEAPE